MLEQLAFGSVLVLITTVVHAACTAATLGVLRGTHASAWGNRSAATRVSLISAVVLMMFLAALFEAGIWAGFYLTVGALPDLETALYFSTVTFTTLGYGDITLDADWRLLASIQAANGTIMFGWTTAIVMAIIHRMVVKLETDAEQSGPLGRLRATRLGDESASGTPHHPETGFHQQPARTSRADEEA